MCDIGILQESYVARHVAGDANVSDLLQGTSVLPHSNGDELRHIAVVIRGHGDGQTSQNHIWFHFQSGKTEQGVLPRIISDGTIGCSAPIDTLPDPV